MAIDDEPLCGVIFLLIAFAIAAAGLIRIFAWSYVRNLLALDWSVTQDNETALGGGIVNEVSHEDGGSCLPCRGRSFSIAHSSSGAHSGLGAD